MKKNISIIVFLLSFIFTNAQTIVKMSLPEQAKEPLKVVVLFDEEVPEGMPVVLGLLGYNVVGGIEPYTYEWFQNGTQIGTGDVVVVTPVKGDNFELKATDKNHCYSTSSFSMKVIRKVDNTTQNEYKIYPTLVTDNIINIEIPESDKVLDTNLRIFDLKGNLIYQSSINGNYIMNNYLPDGTYFVSVKNNEFHKVSKIIVQH